MFSFISFYPLQIEPINIEKNEEEIADQIKFFEQRLTYKQRVTLVKMMHQLITCTSYSLQALLS